MTKGKELIISLILVAYILISWTLFTNTTYSRYVSMQENNESALVSLLESDVIVVNIDEVQGEPGSTNIIPIKINNYKDEILAQVALKYTLTIEKLENNIPLEYNICSDSLGVTEIGKLVTGEFSANTPQSIEYYLKIHWPKEYNNYSYSYKADAFKLIVKSEQID